MKYNNMKHLSQVKNYGEKQIRALGVCLGASTISMVEVRQMNNQARPLVINHSLHAHEGDPKRTLIRAFEKRDLDIFDRIAVTGRKFCNFVNLSSIVEPQAVEYAYQYCKTQDIDCPAVVSAGGETFMVYMLNRSGQISNVITGNKCASGTGEFFLQQLRRMNVSLDEAARWSADEKPHHVSGRCSVFCKSDCTHATNAGIPKKNVTAGLCKMMADKISELLKKVDKKNIMVVGGTSQNRMMLHYLNQDIDNLITPPEAPYFEALGAALWALEHETDALPGLDNIFKKEAVTFDTLPLLKDAESAVEFKTTPTGKVRAGDECLLGLDVGSTTTKAVLIRKADDTMLASIYLRTNGDPVRASRQCYAAILEQVQEVTDLSSISITGLGVTGSGRQIAGLHALTDGVINEIIAHATAAVYFDPQVDTIFEIGGQDAKYTYITNGVPSDYAMNEACSAGTGSFLEEAAYETLGIQMEDIAEIAIRGAYPPNFNDQCAAFISSDIKNAIHEGIGRDDIVAGLVYSICMNYSNRVKGNRPVGEKVFMQGGVCYNRAVPLAMAALTDKPIIVPPEPGLMGAFGVALEVKKRLAAGLTEVQTFDLKVLADRTVQYGKTFICKGGKEKCDRRCEISMVLVENKSIPFGGACNRYYNLRKKIKADAGNLNLVRQRQKLVFNHYSSATATANETEPEFKGVVGLNRSFLVNTYYPLYSNFFNAIGFELAIPDQNMISQKGIDRREAAFCYPAEQAHGFFYSLLKRQPSPNYIFLPHFKAIPSEPGHVNAQLCPFVQSETFYMQTTFRSELDILKRQGVKVLSPLIDLTEGLEMARETFVEIATEMDVSINKAYRAFEMAKKQQTECEEAMRIQGQKVLQALEADPDKFAIVMFGRSYNAFTEESNKGIPHKLASRGVPVIPFDFLDYGEEASKTNMFWGMGQRLLKAARFVEKHPQLFGVFITNFSCGPDSFIVGYFRNIMGRKPSLTLELDSHTADAGLETRIEAFLDIIASYRQLQSAVASSNRQNPPMQTLFKPASTLTEQRVLKVVTSSDEIIPMTDKRVTFLIPSMGETSVEAMAAVFRSSGLNAIGHPAADENILKLGRANTSCKECLPLILTTGTLLNYIRNTRRKNEVLVYFMPTATGPCRFGQYHIFMRDLIKKMEIQDVALFSLSSENSYAGLGNDFHRRAWWGIVVSDVMEDIRAMILTNAIDAEAGTDVFKQEWQQILTVLEKGNFDALEEQLKLTAARLKQIPKRLPLEDVPVVTLAGEIFVRREPLSRQYITELLAKKGFAAQCAPIAEWMIYSDYLLEEGLTDYIMTKGEKIEFFIKKKFMGRYEKRIKALLAKSDLVHPTPPLNINAIIKTAAPYVKKHLSGETVLTVGSIIREVASHTCGAIAIGPFGCMPNRVAEAILNDTMNKKSKLAAEPRSSRLRATLKDIDDLPFLAIESDGSPFPQIINAKLEAFCLRARRLHQAMTKARKTEKGKLRVLKWPKKFRKSASSMR